MFTTVVYRLVLTVFGKSVPDTLTSPTNPPSPWGIPVKKGSPLTGRGHDLSPLLGFVEDVGVGPEGAQPLVSQLRLLRPSSNLKLPQ